MPSRLAPCGPTQPVREQVQPQVGVMRVGGLVRRGRVDRGAHRHHLDTAVGIEAGQTRELGGDVVTGELHRAGFAGRAQLEGGKPGVQDGPVGGDGGQADARCCSHVGQGYWTSLGDHGARPDVLIRSP